MNGERLAKIVYGTDEKNRKDRGRPRVGELGDVSARCAMQDTGAEMAEWHRVKV